MSTRLAGLNKEHPEMARAITATAARTPTTSPDLDRDLIAFSTLLSSRQTLKFQRPSVTESFNRYYGQAMFIECLHHSPKLRLIPQAADQSGQRLLTKVF
jgi:hypothetical protein